MTSSSTKTFVAFDGEGSGHSPHNYFLLASSDNKYIINENRDQLSLNQTLEFLTRPELSNTVNVWYAFNYDICMIFRDLPTDLQNTLFHGKDIIYNNYKIHYIPKKIFTIKPFSKHHGKSTSFKFFDIFGFFQTGFLKACEKWNIPIPQIIKTGKANREEFAQWNTQDIVEYNNQELVLLKQLIEKLEAQLQANQINLSSYHGAGAIASFLLSKWIPYNTHTFKKQFLYPVEDDLPNWVRLSSRVAYFGGRIELFKRYDYNDIYHYDINSAYPTAIQFLPDLSKAQWYYKENPSLNDLLDSNGNPKFGLCECYWNTHPNIVGPLPFRTKNGLILFPNYSIDPRGKKIRACGRYHIIEVVTALKKGYSIEINNAFILEEPYTYPLKQHIQETAQKRLELKKINELLSMPLKLGMNSLYGKFAQKPLDNKIPIWRELLFAGFITAYTRAELLKYLKPKSVILCATDGLYSLEDLDCPLGQNLGEWEFKKHKTGKFLLAGIYLLDEKDMKTRGFPQIPVDKFNEIFQYEKNRSENSAPYIIKDRTFVGIRKGLRLNDKSLMCTFQEIDRIIDSYNNEKRVFYSNDESLPNNITRACYSYPYNDGKIRLAKTPIVDEYTGEIQDVDELDYESYDS